jgi:hypothetical protein
MHNVDSIGEIAIFRKVTQKAPEPKNEYYPRDPDNIQNFSFEPMVNEIQASRNAQNAPEVEFERVKIQPKQYACAEIHKLCRKLRGQLIIDAARTIQCINAWGAVDRIQPYKAVLPQAGKAEDRSYDLPGSEAGA